MAETPMDRVDTDWPRIREALADSAWDFRTEEGLSKATDLPVKRVADLLSEHGDEIRVANVPDPQGRLLYTLADRPMKLREALANVQAFIAKSL
jgi:hypothetical protein